MGVPLRLLIVEDSDADELLMLRELQRAGYDIAHHRVDNAAAMTAALGRQQWDVVIGDYSMPAFSGTAALKLLREHNSEVPFIFVSGTIRESIALEAVRAGAQDYVMKGDLQRLVLAIERELRDAEVRRERGRAQQSLLERARLAELTGDVGVALACGVELDETLQTCAEALVRHLDAVVARIWTVDDATERSHLRASAGHFTQENGGRGSGPVGRYVKLIARGRRPHVSNEVGSDPVLSDEAWAARQGIVSFAGYPLIVQDRVAGVLAMFARQSLSDSTLKTLAGVADALAVGIGRQHAEEARRETEERFTKIFRANPVGIAISTLDTGTFLDANDAFLRTMGCTRQEVVGRSAVDLALWPDPAARARLLALLRAGPVHDHDVPLRALDGTTRDVRLSLEHVEIGGETCLLSMVHDVTKKKMLERQLRQAQRLEVAGRLAGGVAHDFNNLLTVITSNGDLLLEEMDQDDPRREDVVEIRHAARRAADLTRQLLAFSRQQVLQPKVIDLNAIVLGAEKLLERLIREDIQLDTVLAPDLRFATADPGQMEQIIVNLAVNARDAMPAGGLLTIETANADVDESFVEAHPGARAGSYVILAVSDTGIGMDEQTQAQMFEPFFTTKEVGKGTGLGLPTVYGIVQQSGGFISVSSEPGRGTSVKVYFPSAQDGLTPAAADVQLVEVPRGTETVLLVEDDAAVRSITRRVLEGQGYVVLEASNGHSALQVVEQHQGPIHLLLTDVVMPVMGGRELASRLVRLRPDTRVLYASGYPDHGITRNGILEVGIAYIQKPFTVGDLILKVHRVLTETQAGR
jgi:PAS domain S-box-containing protein